MAVRRRLAALRRLWAPPRTSSPPPVSVGGSVAGLPQRYRLGVEDEPDQAAWDFLPRALETFNESRWPGHMPWRPIGVFVRDADTIVAGLLGETYGGWLFIKFFWVREDLRTRGVGRELMAQAEQRAIERGCHAVWLDTFSFQARDFYKKLGYEEFGTLDYPPIHRRHFMKKSLVVNR